MRAIHNNSVISKMYKFNYFNSLLAFLRAIQRLTFSTEKYDAEIEILKNFFGRAYQIITANVNKILKIPACTGERLPSQRFGCKSFEKFVNPWHFVRSAWRTHHNGKITDDIRLEIARKPASSVWKIENVTSLIPVGSVEAHTIDLFNR